MKYFKSTVLLLLSLCVLNSYGFANDKYKQLTLKVTAVLGEEIQKNNLNYDQSHLICAKERQDFAETSGDKKFFCFGASRFLSDFGSPYRFVTPLGVNLYLSWRKPVIALFLPFLQSTSEGRGNLIEKEYQSGYLLRYQIFGDSLKTMNENKFSVLMKELNLTQQEMILSLKELLLAFPRMDKYPIAENLSIVALTIFFRGAKIGDYLMAVETPLEGTAESKDALSLQARANAALKTLEKEVPGGECALLYIHSDVKVGSEMKAFAKLAYDRIFQGRGDDTYSKDQLINDLAELRWYKSQALEYTRGSASIGEWIEQSLAIAHGYKLTRDVHWIDSSQNDRDLADLYAFIMPLDEFINNYRTYTVLEK